ncbi:hypothetical protein SAMN04487906_3228 [Zhouia amylolytica]|uniref:HMA domain-containing protein n=1 Tax=Zhouia amylolytica TaxID=376730 RepID=A0A1I6VM35_9FLAO|nr:hypothetical protein [Zhouia amylolytica]MCQ0112756.1 hypothetical protein [Zhouia amylolytica]SFT14681.1 hypothetical protein SAMN04487906_3228 [Zhouia amylolytica]
MDNNNEFLFKTNLNCGGCISKVQSDLDSAEGICHWDVDTNNADKILAVKSDGITEDEIMTIVKSKGFQIKPLI